MPVTSATAEQAIEAIHDSPKPLQRPVLVLAGWADPGFMSHHWRSALRDAGVQEDDVLALTFWTCSNFDQCRQRVIDAVQAKWPGDDPRWTTEVDVVAFSMGGLVARYAAAPPMPDSTGSPTRLHIARLFTISTPHRGAKLSEIRPAFDKKIRWMRHDSLFLEHLDAELAKAGYELTCYTRLGDTIVGEENTAPDDRGVYWIDTPPFNRAHQEAYRDPRIEADILLRLRGEEPLAVGAPTPLP